MTRRTSACDAVRKSVVLLTCIVLVAGSAQGVFAQSPPAAIMGVILDPEGKPAAGFKVVLRDVGSSKEFLSGPADPDGNYTVQVPVGGRYKLEAVLAGDGATKLRVQDVPR